jgi:hypothetical protein
MKPYLFERVTTPTMGGKCRTICNELGTHSEYGIYIFTHGSMHITTNWADGVTIAINNIVLYRNRWMLGVKPECKQKIKQIVDDLFIKALDSRIDRLKQQREQNQLAADKRNQVCKEFNIEGD